MLRCGVAQGVSQGREIGRRPRFSLRRKDHGARHGLCTRFASMKTMNGIEEVDLDQEYEDWDWVRTAGVSAEDLRQALKNSLEGDEAPLPRVAKAA